MFVPFETLPDNSRVWIYQANRKISSPEKDIIFTVLTSFTQEWQVHGQPMKSSFQLYHDQFIVLAADEGYNAASGCSIDGSVRTLKNLGEQLGVDFFDRNSVAFKVGEEIIAIPLSTLKQKNSEGVWNSETITFNNLVANKGNLEREWKLPAGQTWLKRYLQSPLQKVTQ